VVASGPDYGKQLALDRGTYRVGTEQGSDLQLSDPSVSRTHLVVKVLSQEIELTDSGSTNGSFFRGARFSSVRVQPPAELRLGRTDLRLVALETATSARPPSTADHFGQLQGRSLAMRELFALLENVAPTDSDLLLLGETGTGKELCAEAIHSASSRSSRPFVVCDLAAVSPSLLESELFGHVRGAFTGAHQARSGVFEAADGGTLFLDEIGELSLELQPRLLRALEKRQVKRVGANDYRSVNVRVVAATHRDLSTEVREGRFREDLYHRLAVLVARLPPLRERPDDILDLALHFAQELGADASALSAETQALLRGYHWPGNLRELRNIVERVVRLGDPSLQLAEETRSRPSDRARVELPFKEAKEQLVDAFERDYVRQLLAAHGGNISRAAKQAGIVRVYLQRLIKKHGLRAGDD
jgi:transcriptional regulator with GAF, ATPase, and Fis domain